MRVHRTAGGRRGQRATYGICGESQTGEANHVERERDAAGERRKDGRWPAYLSRLARRRRRRWRRCRCRRRPSGTVQIAPSSVVAGVPCLGKLPRLIPVPNLDAERLSLASRLRRPERLWRAGLWLSRLKAEHGSEWLGLRLLHATTSRSIRAERACSSEPVLSISDAVLILSAGDF